MFYRLSRLPTVEVDGCSSSFWVVGSSGIGVKQRKEISSSGDMMISSAPKSSMLKVISACEGGMASVGGTAGEGGRVGAIVGGSGTALSVVVLGA